MIRNFLNKMRQPAENKAQPTSPRDVLAARLDFFRQIFETTERNFRAGWESHTEMDRVRANCEQAQRALDAFDTERELAAARRAELERLTTERGPALFKEAERLDAKIESIVFGLEQVLAEAQSVVNELDRDFRTYGGYAAPFSSTLVERLQFWSRGIAVRHHEMTDYPGRFTDLIAEYRRIGTPAPEPKVHRPTPMTDMEKAKRLQVALKNARAHVINTGKGAAIAR